MLMPPKETLHLRRGGPRDINGFSVPCGLRPGLWLFLAPEAIPALAGEMRVLQLARIIHISGALAALPTHQK